MPPKPRKPPPRAAAPRNRTLLAVAGGAAVVIIALVAASLLLRGGDDDSGADATATSTTSPSTLLDGIPQDRAILGSEDATVTLIQFEDLQCPVCKTYQEQGFPGIVEEYVRPGKVKLRFVGMAFLGPDSEKALLHVLAAGEQGKLWQYADSLYASQGEENSGWVTDELLERLAGELELDWAKLQEDADGPVVLQQANSMAAEAQQREIPGTPWFYVQVGDDEPYEVRPGSYAIEEFRAILDDALDG